jgi:eukaryotic-like serine/threonine-protein kinase
LSEAMARVAAAVVTDPVLCEATLERKLGEAYLGLGQLTESRNHARRALELLGEKEPLLPLPRTFAVARQIAAQAVRWARPRRAAENGAASEKLMESIRAYEQLDEIYYLANDTLGFLQSCLRTLNLAEKSGVASALARASANMGVTAGTVPIHFLAEAYLRRAQELAAETASLATHAWVQLATGIYCIGIGQWERARETIRGSMAICEQLGNQRQLGVLRTLLGGTHVLVGEFDEAVKVWSMLSASGKRRNDVLHIAWGFGGLSLNHMLLGKFDTAIEQAQSALELFRSNADRVSEITTAGVLVSAHLRRGEVDDARQWAVTTSQQIRQLKFPNSYYLLQGYSSVAEFCMYEWEQHARGKTTAATSHRTRARAAVNGVRAYSRVFPIGVPRYCLWRGRFLWQEGAEKGAVTYWRRGIDTARRLGMLYDLELINSEMNRHDLDE